ncbi:MAG: DUF3810 family protein [Bacilli bacterium]|nr:DUF3810 family protein [Bacilli bacterium]
MCFFLLLGLKSNPDICEAWSRGLMRFHTSLFGKINSWIPFSVTDILMIIIIAGGIFLLVTAIISFIKKNPWRGVAKLMTIALVVMGILVTYNATFEFAYNRKTLDIELYENKVHEDDYYKIVEYFVDDMNKCAADLQFKENGELATKYSNSRLNSLLKREYSKLTSDYFSSYTPTVKPMVTSFIFTWFGITGWFFAPTGEAAVNINTTAAELPFCYAHEMSHSKGVASENDAQVVAAYITLNDMEDSYIRYSGYISILGSILNMAKYSSTKDAYKTLYNKVDPRIIANSKYINQYWKSKAIMTKLGDAINNFYLKLSGQSSGTQGYSDTKPVIGEDGKVVSLSRYQKLVVKIFANRHPNALQ